MTWAWAPAGVPIVTDQTVEGQTSSILPTLLQIGHATRARSRSSGDDWPTDRHVRCPVLHLTEVRQVGQQAGWMMHCGKDCVGRTRASFEATNPTAPVVQMVT